MAPRERAAQNGRASAWDARLSHGRFDRRPAGLWSPDHLAQDPRAAPNELRARHGPAAGQPDLGQLQKALAGYEGRGVTHRAEATGVTTGIAAGLVGTARDQGPCREDRDSAGGRIEPAPGPRLECPDLALAIDRGPPGIEAAVRR